jgi:hypothetical protein
VSVVGGRRVGPETLAGAVLLVAAGGVLLVAAAGAWLGTSGVSAADPTAPPSRPTCEQRFPASGPAGVDLRLGCLLGEIVGTFTGSTDQGDPAPLSSYLEPLLAVVLGLSGAVVALVLARRVLGRRLAPVVPVDWWNCDACRSYNAGSASRCYACGARRPAAARPDLDEAPPP